MPLRRSIGFLLICPFLLNNPQQKVLFMLISHKFKFIFIKTRKTAGTSLEVDLSRLMGREDIVTKICPVEPGHEPRNFITDQFEMYNHMPALDIRNIVGHEMFDGYFKFCVEREPVDKCISYYYMLKNSPFHNSNTSELSWEEFMSNKDFPVDCNKYTDKDGTLLVDKVLRYETLESDLKSIMEPLGVPFAGLHSRAKSDWRGGDIISENVSEVDKKLIYDSFSNSLRFSGYQLF